MKDLTAHRHGAMLQDVVSSSYCFPRLDLYSAIAPCIPRLYFLDFAGVELIVRAKDRHVKVAIRACLYSDLDAEVST